MSPEPAGSMLISPEVDSILFPAIWMLPNVPLLGVIWLLFEPSVIVRLDSACRLVTCCENDTVPFSWSTKNASPTLKSPFWSILT